MIGYWNWSLGFDETLAALRKIGSLENLDTIIENAVDYVALYVDIVEFNHFFKTDNRTSCAITNIKEHLKDSFRIRQSFFRNMADSLEMEKAIKNNDLESLKNLVNQGVPHDIKIYSFFNWKAPTLIFTPSKISSVWTIENLAEICQQQQPTTPLEYAKTLGHKEIADYLEEHAVCFVDD